jgi:colicin import membrane protein
MNPRRDARFLTRSVPRFRAGVMALGVHVAFALLLVFGVSWQVQQPAPVMVDVWDALPAVQPPRAAPPQPAPEPEPEVAPPEPPPPPAVEEPAPPKAPDLALEKKKAEEEKKRAEAEREQALKAKQAAEEKARADAARAEEAKKAREKQAAEQKKRDLLRQIEEEALQRADEEAGLAAQAAAASKRQAAVAGVVAQHIAMISAKVRGNTRLPDNLTGNPEVRCLVKLLPTGEVKSVQVTRSSGNPAYDDAVVRAIEKSSPLPLPDDRDARASFVPELSFVHRPK